MQRLRTTTRLMAEEKELLDSDAKDPVDSMCPTPIVQTPTAGAIFVSGQSAAVANNQSAITSSSHQSNLSTTSSTSHQPPIHPPIISTSQPLSSFGDQSAPSHSSTQSASSHAYERGASSVVGTPTHARCVTSRAGSKVGGGGGGGEVKEGKSEGKEAAAERRETHTHIPAPAPARAPTTVAATEADTYVPPTTTTATTVGGHSATHPNTHTVHSKPTLIVDYTASSSSSAAPDTLPVSSVYSTYGDDQTSVNLGLMLGATSSSSSSSLTATIVAPATASTNHSPHESAAGVRTPLLSSIQNMCGSGDSTDQPDCPEKDNEPFRMESYPDHEHDIRADSMHMPFEFRALEALLLTISNMLEEEHRNLSRLVQKLLLSGK